MKNSIIYFLIFSFLSACSTKKDILYIQDTNDELSLNINYNEYIIKVDDILKIDIMSETPEVVKDFNPPTRSSNINNTLISMQLNSYLVNPSGYIDFPSIGKIQVVGMTIDQLRNKLFEYLVEKEILNNPIIDIKHINAHFTVIGEVKNPGKYEFVKNNLNIFEAIGVAGDLNINGKRSDVTLIREIDGKTTINKIDLTKSDFLSSDFYQIISRDIIIVNPNTNRVKNAGIIGNSGTLLSLLSFLTSLIIVIGN